VTVPRGRLDKKDRPPLGIHSPVVSDDEGWSPDGTKRNGRKRNAKPPGFGDVQQ
jgi:hypothetical protein